VTINREAEKSADPAWTTFAALQNRPWAGFFDKFQACSGYWGNCATQHQGWLEAFVSNPRTGRRALRDAPGGSAQWVLGAGMQ